MAAGFTHWACLRADIHFSLAADELAHHEIASGCRATGEDGRQGRLGAARADLVPPRINHRQRVVTSICHVDAGPIQADGNRAGLIPDEDRGADPGHVGVHWPQLAGLATGDVQLSVGTNSRTRGTARQSKTCHDLLGGRIDGYDFVGRVRDDIHALAGRIRQDNDRATADFNLLE